MNTHVLGEDPLSYEIALEIEEEVLPNKKKMKVHKNINTAP